MHKDDVDDVLFVNNKIGFTLEYLKCHSALELRSAVSSRAAHYCYEETFETEYARFRQAHADAVLYWMTLSVTWTSTRASSSGSHCLIAH